MKSLHITKQRTGRILRSTALRPRSCVPKYNIKKVPKPPHLKKKKKEANNCPRVSKLKALTMAARNSILERINLHEDKLNKILEIGLPIITFNEPKIYQYIKQHQAKIALYDEEHIMKIIGIVGESYIEDPEPKSYEQKEFVIQRKVIQMLINNDIFLKWDQDKWTSLIKKSLIQLPYRGGLQNRNFTNQQKYQQMFAALSHIYHQNLDYSFIQSCPLQANSDIEELTNRIDLHNVRAIRSYLCQVIASLEKICVQKQNLQNLNLGELYKLQTTLQDDIEDYWLIKQNIFTLKTNPKQQKLIEKPIEVVQQKQNKPLPTKVQKLGQGTLHQFFKVISKKKIETQPIVKDISYFDLLENYITDSFKWKEKEVKQ